MGVGEVRLEIEDVPHIRPAESIDRVVGNEPVCDEVVRLLNVQVVNGSAQQDALSIGDYVVALLGEHRHSRTNGRSWYQRQRPGTSARSGKASHSPDINVVIER